MSRQLVSFGTLFLTLCLTTAVLAQQTLDPSLGTTDEEQGTTWYSARHLDVQGQGWVDEAAPFARFPAKAQETVREAVWNLSRHSAGVCVRFQSDSETLHARWTLTSSRLSMTHMPATGVSGLDLYVRTAGGAWRWLSVGRPTESTNEVTLVSNLPRAKREFLLYLPLYNGVTSVEVGVPVDRRLIKPVEDSAKPLVFYGTSITQGGCASRPGMVHTSILSRRFNRPVINLGFSGNGRMEMAVVNLMVELDAAVFVIDCLPNIMASEVQERTEPLVRALRTAHPETPILLVEDRPYSDAFLIPSKRARNETSRAALRAAYERLTSAGVDHLAYLEGDALFGDDGEDTVDSSHPTDLGFMRMADAFEIALRPLLDE